MANRFQRKSPDITLCSRRPVELLLDRFLVETRNILRSSLPAPVWAVLKRVQARMHTRQFNRRIVKHIYHNQQLTVHLWDGLGEGWYDHDWPDQPEISRLARSKLV